MELYDGIIDKTNQLLEKFDAKSFAVDANNGWNLSDRNELIFEKDSAFTLGGAGHPASSFHLVTTNSKKVPKDEILLYGKDLLQIKSDCAYGKIVFLQIEDLGENENAEKAYHQIKDMEFVKYDINPEGFMVRASSFDKLEQVRVGKEAIKKGISFAKIANEYIKAYKQNENVKAVKIIFITDELPIFAQLSELAQNVDKITQTLNKILNDMNLDCASCGLKELCDQVEGMKEMHFQNVKKSKKK